MMPSWSEMKNTARRIDNNVYLNITQLPNEQLNYNAFLGVALAARENNNVAD